MREASRSAAFARIYSERTWGGSSAPRSGTGSQPELAAPYVEYVHATCQEVGAKSVVDIGHGDWSMWPAEAFRGIRYLGLDVVPGLSQEVARDYATLSREFRELDAVDETLPSADVVLCKDVLQHLSNDDVRQLLGKLCAFPTIIICHDVRSDLRGLRFALRCARRELAPRARLRLLSKGRNPFRRLWFRENADCRSGGYRPLDITSPPWNLEDFGLELVAVTSFRASDDKWDGIEKRIWRVRPIRHL
jgi:SAM-dependent methyltransferase